MNVWTSKPLNTSLLHSQSVLASCTGQDHRSQSQEAREVLKVLTPISKIFKLLTGEVSNTDCLVTVQVSTGEPRVQEFMWLPLDMHHPSKHRCGPSSHHHGDGSGALRTMRPATPQEPLSDRWMWLRAQGVDLTSKFPRSQSDQASVGHAGRILILRGSTLKSTLVPEVLYQDLDWSEPSLIHWCLCGLNLFWHVSWMPD